MRSFIHACNDFTYIEDLTSTTPTPTPTPATQPKPSTPKKSAPASAKPPQKTSAAITPATADQLRKLVVDAADSEGWADLAKVCLYLHNHPALKAALAPHMNGKAGRYLMQTGLFDVTERPVNGTPVRYLRVIS